MAAAAAAPTQLTDAEYLARWVEPTYAGGPAAAAAAPAEGEGAAASAPLPLAPDASAPSLVVAGLLPLLEPRALPLPLPASIEEELNRCLDRDLSVSLSAPSLASSRFLPFPPSARAYWRAASLLALLPNRLPDLNPHSRPRNNSANKQTKQKQGRLRRNQYDFSKADKVLSSLGVSVNPRFKPSQSRGDAFAAAGEAAAAVAAVAVAEAEEAEEAEEAGDAPAAAGAPASASAQGPSDKAEGVDVPLRPSEKRPVDFRGKLYLAPLTTVGNLPFRRLCKGLGADVTCGEMALATSLLQGSPSEWALLRRHPSEDLFGAQLCGGYADALARAAQLVEERCTLDFVDVNMGCPIDLVCNKGAGSFLLTKPQRLETVVRAMAPLLSCPLTVKLRIGYEDDRPVAHKLLPKAAEWGAFAATLHGRTRAQRYSRRADWGYIARCAAEVEPTGLQLIGNGDVFSYVDYERAMAAPGGGSGGGGGGLWL